MKNFVFNCQTLVIKTFCKLYTFLATRQFEHFYGFVKIKCLKKNFILKILTIIKTIVAIDFRYI